MCVASGFLPCLAFARPSSQSAAGTFVRLTLRIGRASKCPQTIRRPVIVKASASSCWEKPFFGALVMRQRWVGRHAAALNSGPQWLARNARRVNARSRRASGVSSTCPKRLALRCLTPASLEQEPRAPLCLVDPDLQQARRCDVVMFVAQPMRFAHSARELLVLIAQL